MRSSALPFLVSLVGSSLIPACSASPGSPSQPLTPGCPAGATACSTGCKDLTSDAANCGSCGVVCPVSTSCVSGACTCSAGLAACTAGCVDLTSDAGNCGACGAACPTGQVCSASVCKGACDAGLTLCGASCVDVSTSPTHCGVCGNVCGAGLGCVAGSCGCSGGLTLCGSECVDTASSALHCGACGVSCAGGASCVAGACAGGTGGAGTGGTGTGGELLGGASTGGATGGTAGTGGATGGTAGTGGELLGGAGTGGATGGTAGTGGELLGGAGTGGVTVCTAGTGCETCGGTGGSEPGVLHGCTATIADATLEQEYTSWRSAFVVSCSDTQARVQAGGNTSGSVSNETFSEGIGYGMLLAVAFDDQPTFDQLWAYYKAARNANGLMNWKMNACTGTPYEQNGASDGDLDTAMALVQADRRWGGYTADANELLGAIRTYETMECGGITVLRPGDAWGLECSTGNLNPSYFCPGYYRAFAVYQPDAAAFWNKFADDSITLLLDYQQEAGGALMGEWAYTDRLADTSYGYNACRTPWRVAVDYAWWGTAGAQTYLANVAAYVDSHGGVANVPFDKNSAFLGAFALSGIATDQCDAYHQSWMSGAQYDDRYFQATLRVLALALMAGRFVF